MKCVKCGNELVYKSDEVLECAYCHALYSVDEKTSEQHKDKKPAIIVTEVSRPNCDVVKITATEDKKVEEKKEKTPVSLPENSVQIIEPKKNKSLFVFIANLLMFIPFLFLPFINITKTVYNDSISIIDYSIYFYKNPKLIIDEIFSDSGFLIITAIISTIIILLMLIVGIVIYITSYDNIHYVYEIITLLSLILIICFVVCYFSVPVEVGSLYSIYPISYIYFSPVLSIINLVIIKKKPFNTSI